jgi:hypothetical protein
MKIAILHKLMIFYLYYKAYIKKKKNAYYVNYFQTLGK